MTLAAAGFTGGATITDVTFAGYNGFFSSAAEGFEPAISFTGSQINIVWNSEPMGGQFIFLQSGCGRT